MLLGLLLGIPHGKIGHILLHQVAQEHPYWSGFSGFVFPAQTEVMLEEMHSCDYTHHHCAPIVLNYRTQIIRGECSVERGCFHFRLLVRDRCMRRDCNNWRNTFIPLLTRLAHELQKFCWLYVAYQSSWIHCGVQYPGPRHRISQLMQLWQTYYPRRWEANLALPWQHAIEVPVPGILMSIVLKQSR